MSRSFKTTFPYSCRAKNSPKKTRFNSNHLSNDVGAYGNVSFRLLFFNVFFSPDHFNIDRRPVLRPFSVAADAVDLNKRRICVVCVSVSSAGSILMAETKAQRRQTDLRLGPSTPQRQSSTSKRQTANSERDRRLIVFSSFFCF